MQTALNDSMTIFGFIRSVIGVTWVVIGFVRLSIRDEDPYRFEYACRRIVSGLVIVANLPLAILIGYGFRINSWIIKVIILVAADILLRLPVYMDRIYDLIDVVSYRLRKKREESIKLN